MPDEDRRMYELEYPAPVVDSANDDGNGPTLVVAMSGYADAGQAVDASAAHLLAALESRPVAAFNNDELIDYRSRRPAVTIDADSPMEIEQLDLSMRVVRDNREKPFLLLSGPEPDLRWEGFTNAVADLADKFDVSETICLYAAPMPVPHTRPLVITAHGNSRRLKQRMFKLDSTMMVPGSAQLYLEKELADRGRKVAGFTVHVPHYLASSPYPHATLQLLESVATAAGLDLPLGSLEHDVERVNQQLAEQVEDSEEVNQVVHQLEEQYDSFLEHYRDEHPQAVLPGEQNMPTGEEISEEFERFLAYLDDQDPEVRRAIERNMNHGRDDQDLDSGAGPEDHGEEN